MTGLGGGVAVWVASDHALRALRRAKPERPSPDALAAEPTSDHEARMPASFP